MSGRTFAAKADWVRNNLNEEKSESIDSFWSFFYIFSLIYDA